MHLPDSVHRHPNAVCNAAVKRQLGVGGDGAGIETYASCKFAEIVHGLVTVPPEEGFAALKVYESGTERIAVAQLLLYISKRLVIGEIVVINAAVLAAEIAAVRYENHALERFPAT